MKLVKSTLGVIVLGAAVMFLASPAHAKGRVHIDVPGFSIGFYDNHHNRHGYSKRYRQKDRYRNQYRNRSHRQDYYRYDDNRRGYSQNGYRDRYYNDAPYQRGYNQSNTICPNPGYSRYRIQRGHCTRHKDHFHCE